MSSKPAVVLSINEWNPSAMRYMVPKLNKSGGKSISIISEQTKRSLHVSTPLLMTWGISDFVNEDGNADGKYTISLQFPNAEYETPAAIEFLKKLKEFETQILNDAVKNSELWWGEHLELAVAKHTFFPVLKYSKNPDTKKIDYSKAPTIRAKVNNYDNVWNVEIYDVNQQILFPNDNKDITPMDFVPKLSQVACVLQCGGVWIGGKGWGVTWKLIQCVVKPREVVSIYGSCHIRLTDEDKETLKKQVIPAIDNNEIIDDEEQYDNGMNDEPSKNVATNDFVPDSDDETHAVEPVVIVPPTTPVKKMVVKKTTVPVVVDNTPEVNVSPPSQEVVEPTVEPVKKKVIKKVVKST
jgi:hypothetical protein